MSSFQGFTCWNAEDVEQVTNPLALDVNDEIFAAVHTPMKIGIQRGVSSQSFESHDENEIIKDFNDEDVNHQFILVKGAAGSGKSHLVRWVSTQMPSTGSRHVVLVPRAQTNLRGMISSLLQGFEEDETFDQYRESLKSAKSTPSPEAGRDRLLSQLAHTIEHNYVPGDTNEEYDEFAAERLPPLLHEPYFREHYWLTEDGVIARLYNRALGTSEKDVGKGNIQRFEEDDLPKDIGGNVSTGNQEVLEFYDLLQNNEKVREATLRVLNRHRDAAVQQMLNFTGDDLLDLFLDIREKLYERGKELVLLIEDVARQQGLSGAILEALIIPPNEIESRSLCRVRSLVGITPDPFDLLPQNIRQRATSVISLDQEETGSSEDAMLSMAARYLNAARISTGKLQKWHETSDADLPPSACDDCPFKSKCHDAFGAIDGMGLYPYNEAALKEMYRRKHSEGFNPRVLLRDILRWPLKSGVEMIEKGEFPSRSLHEEFGGTQGWSADELDKVRSMPDSERRVPLLDLWSTRQKAENLKEGIHEAFNIERVEVASSQSTSRSAGGTSEEGSGKGTTDSSKSSTDSSENENRDSPNEEDRSSSSQQKHDSRPRDVLTEARQSAWASFDNWANGESIDMTVVNSVRKRIRSALYHYIDWDSERLLRSSLYGNRVFENESINFEGQAASLGNAEVVIELPLSSQTRTSVASGVQALLLYDHHEHWKFDGGEDRLVKYASLLEKMADAVVKQLRRPPGPNGSWNPGVTAAEVLRLGARSAGKPAASQTSLADRLDALFEKIPSTDEIPSSVSREWRNFMEDLCSSQEKLRQLVKAYNICPKGGQSANLLLDSSSLLPILNRIDVRPRTEFPVDDVDLPRRLRFLHQFVFEPDDLLEKPVQRETKRWGKWLDLVSDNIGSPERLSDTIETVKTTVSALEDVAAIRVSNSKVESLRRRCDEINASDYKHLWSRAQSIRDGEDNKSISAQLREIGYVNRPHLSETHDATRELISLANETLSSSEEWIRKRLDETSQGEERLREVIGRFTEILHSLASKIHHEYSGEIINYDSKNPLKILNSVEPSDIITLSTKNAKKEESGDKEHPALIRRSKSIDYLVDRYKTSRKQGKYTQDLYELQGQFDELLNRLGRVEKAEAALRTRGVDIDPLPVDNSLVENVYRQCELIKDDLNTYLSSENNETRNVFIKRLDNSIEMHKKRIIKKWKKYIKNEISPSYNEGVVSVFDGIPAFQEHVDVLEQQINILESLKEKLPIPDIVDDAVAAGEQIEYHLSELFGETDLEGQMLPNAVARFLQQASDGQASIDSLNDEVEEWLEDRGIKDAFVITVNPDTYGK